MASLATKSQVYLDMEIDDEPIGRIVIMVRVLFTARCAAAATTARRAAAAATAWTSGVPLG